MTDKSDKATAAKNREDAENNPSDTVSATETKPGGEYKVGGQIVDANGEPIGK